MIAAITPAIEPLFGWALAIGSLLILGASLFALGLGRAAGKAMPEMPADDWGREVVGLDETPIYTATAAHIAKHAVADLDREWAEMGGAS